MSSTEYSRNRVIVQLYKAGLTAEEIASHFDRSQQRINQILKRHGITRRDRGATPRAELLGMSP